MAQMTPQPWLLNIRPEPQASRFAAGLAARYGAALPVITSPLMQTVFLSPLLPPDHFAALVLTSEAGAMAAAGLRRAGAVLPDLAFCVGDRTAEIAKIAVTETVSAKGDARDLLALLAGRAEDPLLYLHGEDRAADLGVALAPGGRRVVSVVAYRQQEMPLNPAATAALTWESPLIVPLFSPRSARLFLRAVAGQGLDHINPVVISENTRAVLPEMLAKRALIADRPDGPSMLAAIARLVPPPLP
ncbi:uroporphyrinogen-III synthase [Xinfangfangia sp. D13-10-4-6]|uniref:uroporphyrinogen-III synthase n=1 Tax=Pseudogemmobacter hezensis TaxID=2737662 RepID=UPI001554A099|nr:uroporphyrinogen-III synthase [Pseudogemmobacter hezensis]NPD17390.1 uroporphyrinogen-III synthase [Pseudogemmobacter hezensis]